VLPWLQPGVAGNMLAEVQKAPNLMPEFGEGLVIAHGKHLLHAGIISFWECNIYRITT